jgi:lysyl-tRNA synthetase class 2
MMEFYQAYATYEDLMDLTEDLICHLAEQVVGSLQFKYGERDVDLSRPWQRLTVRDAVLEYGDISEADIDAPDKLLAYADKLGLELDKSTGYGKVLMEVFDAVAEPELWQPTFITQYPTEVSPLSRKNDQNPDVVDRFELFVVGRDLANAFSELNDPDDQRERFVKQLAEKEAGDEEAHAMDEDYIRALEYGLPPTAGEGIGIDRLVMLLTNSQSIRDVILFPQMRPERQVRSEEE